MTGAHCEVAARCRNKMHRRVRLERSDRCRACQCRFNRLRDSVVSRRHRPQPSSLATAACRDLPCGQRGPSSGPPTSAQAAPGSASGRPGCGPLSAFSDSSSCLRSGRLLAGQGLLAAGSRIRRRLSCVVLRCTSRPCLARVCASRPTLLSPPLRLPRALQSTEHAGCCAGGAWAGQATLQRAGVRDGHRDLARASVVSEASLARLGIERNHSRRVQRVGLWVRPGLRALGHGFLSVPPPGSVRWACIHTGHTADWPGSVLGMRIRQAALRTLRTALDRAVHCSAQCGRHSTACAGVPGARLGLALGLWLAQAFGGWTVRRAHRAGLVRARKGRAGRDDTPPLAPSSRAIAAFALLCLLFLLTRSLLSLRMHHPAGIHSPHPLLYADIPPLTLAHSLGDECGCRSMPCAAQSSQALAWRAARRVRLTVDCPLTVAPRAETTQHRPRSLGARRRMPAAAECSLTLLTLLALNRSLCEQLGPQQPASSLAPSLPRSLPRVRTVACLALHYTVLPVHYYYTLLTLSLSPSRDCTLPRSTSRSFARHPPSLPGPSHPRRHSFRPTSPPPSLRPASSLSLRSHSLLPRHAAFRARPLSARSRCQPAPGEARSQTLLTCPSL